MIDWEDGLIVLGGMSIGGAAWLAYGWPGLLAVVGIMLVVSGLGVALWRRKQ